MDDSEVLKLWQKLTRFLYVSGYTVGESYHKDGYMKFRYIRNGSEESGTLCCLRVFTPNGRDVTGTAVEFQFTYRAHGLGLNKWYHKVYTLKVDGTVEIRKIVSTVPHMMYANFPVAPFEVHPYYPWYDDAYFKPGLLYKGYFPKPARRGTGAGHD